jgi:hypothetical protein
LTKVLDKAILQPYEMTSNGKYLWFVNGVGGSALTRMDIATGASTTNDSLLTAAEVTIASDNNYVWVGGSRLLRVSKATNKIKVIDPKLTGIRALASNGTTLWALWGNRHLVEMNIATDKIKSFYNPMFQFTPGLAMSGHDIWMIDSYDHTVLRFDTISGTVTEINSSVFSSTRYSKSLFALTSEGKRVWVSVLCDKFVDGVDDACGTVQEITTKGLS